MPENKLGLNDAAFATIDTEYCNGTHGLTKLEYIATHLTAALLTRNEDCTLQITLGTDLAIRLLKECKERGAKDE